MAGNLSTMRTRFLGSDVWLELDRLGREPDKFIAVPYVSNASAFRFAGGDQLITNASREAIASGQTSVPLLLRAAIRGAQVYSLPDLHAKILLTKRAAVIGSANLSQSSRRLKEAAVLVTEAKLLSHVRRYLHALLREAIPLNVAELRELSNIPVVRPGKPTFTAGRKRPSLLEALRTGDPLLNTLGFFWYTPGGDLKKSVVRRRAQRLGVPLPHGQRWEWYETPMFQGAVRSERRLSLNRALVSWEAKLDRDELISRFNPQNDRAVAFIDAFRHRGFLVSIVGTSSFRTPFDMRRDRQALARILTAGINASSSLRRTLSSHRLGLITGPQLQRMYQLGKDAA